MKTLLIYASLSMSVLLPVGPSAIAAENGTLKSEVSTNQGFYLWGPSKDGISVNFRSAPSKDSKIIAVIRDSEVVFWDIDSEPANNYYPVKLKDGRRGFMHKNYIKPLVNNTVLLNSSLETVRQVLVDIRPVQ